MQPDENPQTVEVRYRTGYSVFMTVFGALFLLLGVVLLAIPGSEYPVYALGATSLLLIFGVVSFSRPYCSYDASEGALYLYPLIGPRGRAIGAPRGEQLCFDGSRIVRITAAGKQRTLNLSMLSNPDDLARLQRALPAMH